MEHDAAAARPSTTSETSGLAGELDLSIERARLALLATQRDDGSWDAATDVGPAGEAMYFIIARLFEVLSTQDAEEGARYLLAQQRPDGSFAPYPGATRTTVSATALCRAGLLACGLRARHAAVQHAFAFIEAHGGHAAVTAGLAARGDMAGLFLLAMGVVDASFLPKLPPELALTPFDRMIDRRVHAGNIMVALVLCAMVARYARQSPQGVLATAVRAAEYARIRSYLFSWQNESGDWNGQSLQTELMLLGLAATGLQASDARIARALGWLRQLRRRHAAGLALDAMRTDVWSTAWCSLALHYAGEAADGPALTAAQRHLLSAQVHKPMPRVNQRKPDATRTGGFPFQRGNDTMPDTDDTGMVLAALATLQGERCTREVHGALDRAVRFLRDMQNPEGGFPAFVWNLPPKAPGPMYLADVPVVLDSPARALAFLLQPPPEFSDPAGEGVTGRVLFGLGAAGVGRDDPAVCRAIDFLRAQQCDNGAWWGRWMVCYLVETATTLLGLHAVGEDMRAAYVERATRFLLAHQNADGGFGEAPEVYRDPARAGEGPSVPPVTGFVLLGLLQTPSAPREALERAARYLMRHQQPDGAWSNAGWLHVVYPPDSFYVYDIPARALPLMALARYRDLVHAEQAS